MPIIPLATGVSLIGGATQALNVGGQIAQNYYNRKYAEEQYRTQRIDALNDRDYANNYNSPTQQIKRYKEAGLNPNLMYGGGATAQQAAVQTQQADTKNVQAQAPQIDGSSVLQMFYDIQRIQAQTDLVREQSKQSEISQSFSKFQLGKESALLPGQLQGQAIDNRNKMLTGDNQFTSNAIQQMTLSSTVAEAAQRVVNLQKDEMLKTLTLENNPLRQQQIRQEIRLIESRIKSDAVKRALDDKELEMLKNGYTKSDPLWARQLLPFITNLLSPRTNILSPAQEALKKTGRTLGQSYLDHISGKSFYKKWSWDWKTGLSKNN